MRLNKVNIDSWLFDSIWGFLIVKIQYLNLN